MTFLRCLRIYYSHTSLLFINSVVNGQFLSIFKIKFDPMQDTRFNNLIRNTGDRLNTWLLNPWRRWSVITISLLLGFYFGSAMSTVAGQKAVLDIGIAGVLVALSELISLVVYRRLTRRSFTLDSINAFKIGGIYSLFVEAFKLGS